MNRKNSRWCGVRALGVAAVLAATGTAQAKLGEDDLARLGTTGTELTPIGAIRAGNAEGTIPEWTGGITTPPAGYTPGEPWVDPYADDDGAPIGIIGGIVCGVLITCAGGIWCIYTVQQNNNTSTAIVQAQLAQQQAQPQMMMQVQPQMMQPQMQVQVQAQKGFGA